MPKKTHSPRQRMLRAGLLSCAAGCALPALAIQIDTGAPDVTIRWDNTIRLNAGVRTGKPDSRILNNPNYDESDGKFGRGDFVTKRLDLLSELDVSYKNDFGARVSAAGWYDASYDDTSVHTTVPGYTSSYNNN